MILKAIKQDLNLQGENNDTIKRKPLPTNYMDRTHGCHK